MTKADLKRIEDLSAKITEDKKAIEKEKIKVLKMKKELDAEKKKLAAQWKELKNQKKQAALEKDFKKGVAEKESAKTNRKPGGDVVKKLQDEVLEWKTKFNAEGKRARNFKQEVDQLTAENKVLQKKLKNLQGRKGAGEDPRIKHLMHENKMLKKQIRLLMIELNKKRRWFQRCIKSFKSSRQKWIKKQEDTLKKKGFLIKYVFLDDVKKIQGYKEPDKGKKGGKGKAKYKNKVKVKSRDGGVIVLKDVEFVVLDDDDDDSDGGATPKGGKKGKGKKSKGEQLDEMEALIAEFEKELEADQQAMGGGDDIKDDDSTFDLDDDDAGDLDGDYTLDNLMADAAASGSADGDNDDGDAAGGGGGDGAASPRSAKSGSGGGSARGSKNKDYLGLPVQNSIDVGDAAALQLQLVLLKKELGDRTDDVEKLKEIVSDPDKHPDPKEEVKNYLLQINKRGEELVEKLDQELHADKKDVEEIKENNNRWNLWLNNLSLTMAKNGDLFNQLLNAYEYYLKELKGRIDDLSTVNNTFYVDKPKKEDSGNEDGGDDENKQDAEEEEEEEGFGKLKKVVVGRHEEVEGQFKEVQEKQDAAAEEEAKEAEDNYGAEDKEKEALDANAVKVKEIRDNLVSNNSDWRELIDTVSGDYDAATSEKKKLVAEMNETSEGLKELLDLVVKIPKRKILDDDAAGDDENNGDEEPAAGDDAADNED